MPELAYDGAVPPAVRRWADAASPAEASRVLVLGFVCARAAFDGAPGAYDGAPAEPSSVRRGAAAEETVGTILGRRYDVADTAKQAHAADFVIDSPAGPVLVEVKDYSSPVPRREVAKLNADLAARGAVAGVFLSLGSPIAHVAESFAVRFEDAGGPRVPVVYAAPSASERRLPADTILLAAEVAVGLARASATLRADARARDDVVGRLAGVRATLDDLRAARARLRETAAAVNTSLADCAERFAATESRLRDAVGALLADLDGAAERVSANELAAELSRRYGAPAHAPAIGELAARLAGAASPTALDARHEWRFLKTRAVHAAGWGFSFVRGGVHALVPLDAARACGGTEAALLALLVAHPKAARYADGALELALTNVTTPALLSALAAGAE